MAKLRYVSLFSGIEAVSCALDHDVWEPVAFSEIDPFPSAVLAHHYPNVPNLGDITKIDWTPYVDTIDVVRRGRRLHDRQKADSDGMRATPRVP